jgi:Protein of unknown function (DUF1569)
MKDLHSPAVANEIIARIEHLTPDTKGLWGKMTVAQMLAHCNTALQTNMGKIPSKQGLMGKIFGQMAKKSVVSDKPFKQGLPTDKTFVIKDTRDFGQEQKLLIELVRQLPATDREAVARTPHPFFGKMTPNEWNSLNYKHLDHHLRQFGA